MASEVLVRAYLSPTLVLLAFDWPDGAKRDDFLGFAIERSPGHNGKRSNFLLNKIDFNGPVPGGVPSNEAPIQKFTWWDAGIDDGDRGKAFAYTVYPVTGAPENLDLNRSLATTIKVTIPHEKQDGISTYFNRAVVSSQAFLNVYRGPQDLDRAIAWLGNGLEQAIPVHVKGADGLAVATYHLTDRRTVDALAKERGSAAYYLKERRKGTERRATSRGGRRAEDQPEDKGDTVNLIAKQKLEKTRRWTLAQRTKTAIMHDKFIVRFSDEARRKPESVLTGSANFTPEGLTTQANVLHVIDSPALAKLYAERQKLLTGDPTKGETSKQGAGWSKPIKVKTKGGKATTIRVFFSPEPSKNRVSIDTVVDAIKHAKKSVVFALFSPTDKALLEALIAAGDKGKMMLGLLNAIQDPNRKKSDAPDKPPSEAAQVQITLFNRSRKDKMILAYDFFRPGEGNAPRGFLPELSTIDTSAASIVPSHPNAPPSKVPAVHIHHKFIVIDGETASPTIFTGSANMSNNSIHNNDENLLEITGNAALAQTYLAEFFRLYDHFRARALWHIDHPQVNAKTIVAKRGTRKPAAGGDTFKLKTKRSEWDRGAYVRKNAEFYFARVNLARP